jgi:hypothetical protein
MAARGGVAMSDLIWLSEAQMRRIEPNFPLSHGFRGLMIGVEEVGDAG